MVKLWTSGKLLSASRCMAHICPCIGSTPLSRIVRSTGWNGHLVRSLPNDSKDYQEDVKNKLLVARFTKPQAEVLTIVFTDIKTDISKIQDKLSTDIKEGDAATRYLMIFLAVFMTVGSPFFTKLMN
jgi:hypothetical protein